MYILCIETTSTNCSVAIATDQLNDRKTSKHQYCLDLKEDQNDSYSHGERLHVFIDQILKQNNLKLTDLDAVAISKGPGSYTGLRIGVASVKGLCYSLNIPLIEIDTLTALASTVLSKYEVVIPVLDARRMEVYTRTFINGNAVDSVESKIVDPSSFSDLKSNNVVILGTGTEKIKDIIIDKSFAYQEIKPTAATMCSIAINKMKKGDIVEDIAYFEPFYLKEFKAG